MPGDHPLILLSAAVMWVPLKFSFGWFLTNSGPVAFTTRSMNRLIIAACACTGAIGCGAQAADRLTTAREVAMHRGAPAEEEPGAEVAIEATVTFRDSSGTVFLQDDTGATFLRPTPLGAELQRGQRIRVSGHWHPGLYIGGIIPDGVEVLGIAAPVQPLRPSPDDLVSGRFHYQLVEIAGVCRSVRLSDENSAVMNLNVGGRVVEVRLDEAPPGDFTGWIDARIRVRGLAAGSINDRRQLVLPYIRLQNSSDVELVEPAPSDESAIPLVALADLQKTIKSEHRVKLAGMALAGPLAGGLFVREQDRSVFIQGQGMDGIKAGDLVEAVGFPEMGTFSAQLGDAMCRVVGEGDPPEPLIADEKLLQNGCDADLVTLEARVIQALERDGGAEWLCQAGSVSVTAIVPPGTGGPALRDSRVRLTGLCRVTATRSEGYRARPAACALWLREPGDAVLLQRAPWWTPRRLALTLSAVAAMALLALGWIVMLRLQVSRQLAIIEGKAQREAVAEERQRIAREFHDTLEQELAGLSLRLDAATTRVGDPKALALLDQLRKLLSRLQTETRDFVWDLRDASRQSSDLPAAIRSLLEHLQAGTPIPLQFDAAPGIPPLPPLVRHHLLRIVREAAHNAVKYARPATVRVALELKGDRLALTIADDGIGFDPSTVDSMEGHFGIRGMRERAAKVGGDLAIRSAPGQGSRVEFTLALPAAAN